MEELLERDYRLPFPDINLLDVELWELINIVLLQMMSITDRLASELPGTISIKMRDWSFQQISVKINQRYHRSFNRLITVGDVEIVWDYLTPQHSRIREYLRLGYIRKADLDLIHWAIYKDLRSMPMLI
ncbi:uncharacterized protein LOC116416508 [Nasonia vitripennis]|uniref:Uncharacterized protein n=1 Tax=Nasonia vitripennis TaxID=7425 RepID=A0A7M7Q5P9_NASVI|nr:uncharacterized protein LOC116416508 [Nasonia vitripennis]